MHYVYIIYSKQIDKYYIGYTANLDTRIDKHNKPHKGFTGQSQDWRLVYTESFAEKSNALKREKEIKSWTSRSKIGNLIKK